MRLPVLAAALAVIGARPDSTKEVVALEDGYRESTESWMAFSFRNQPGPWRIARTSRAERWMR